MSKFNIYRVERDNKDALVSKLISVGLTSVNPTIINGFNLEFYISTNPDAVEIWWVNYYQTFFQDIAPPQNQIYFGCLLIYNQEICYVISLGKTHFYLKDFCDTEFGINLAERIIDINNLKIKNSKFYKSKRNKTITSYSNNTALDYDTGESLHFLKAKTINPDLWGKVASFGNSVQISLDISVNEIPDLIQRIQTKLSEEPLANFPKAELIRDSNEVIRLDNLLSTAIIDADSSVNSDEFDLSGIDFIFTDNSDFLFKVKGTDIESQSYSELSLENLREFINLNDINLDNLNNIQVKFLREEGRNFSKPLKSILQFITDNQETLIDGKWHKFNQQYINLLIEKVSKIPLNYDITYNYTSRIDENTFNNDRQANGYLNIHTDLISMANRFKVEVMDLYKDKTLFFVKKGTPQKLNYAIDQALNTIKLLKHDNAFKIRYNNENLPVSKINIWILVERVTDISNLSEFNSLIFIMKLNELYKEVTDASLSLECNINYLNRN